MPISESAGGEDRTHRFTYAELAKQLPSRTRSCSARREPVAVLRIRSDDDRNHGRLAGKTYVPLDPQFPPARLAYMIADAQAG